MPELTQNSKPDPLNPEVRPWILRLVAELRDIAATTGRPIPALDVESGDEEIALSIGEQKVPVGVLVAVTEKQLRLIVSDGSTFMAMFGIPDEPGRLDPADNLAHLGYLVSDGKLTLTARGPLPLDAHGLPDLRVLRLPPSRWPELTAPPQPPASEPAPALETPSSLAGPRVRSRKALQPSVVQSVFTACTAPQAHFLPFIDGEAGGVAIQRGRDSVRLHHPEAVPLPLRNANVEKEALEAWARAGTRRDLERLDDTAWDVAGIALTAFYARTPGDTIDHRFPVLVDDYLDWRGVDPRHRTEALRQEVLERLKLVCSDRFHVYSETHLHVKNPETGRRKKQAFTVKGPFLIWAGDLYRNGQRRLALEGADRPDGVLLNLGEWARRFVEEKAMLGVHLKRLAEYDLRRQLWERRIGQYLLFQMQNQATKGTWNTTKKGGKVTTTLAPQHALFMRTVLDGAGIEWQEIAKSNPGKVIRQWRQALETLKTDGVIGGYHCQDGKPDGADLPVRGRLEAMLGRRWLFLPGGEQALHLKGKRDAAAKARRSSKAPA